MFIFHLIKCRITILVFNDYIPIIFFFDIFFFTLIPQHILLEINLKY